MFDHEFFYISTRCRRHCQEFNKKYYIVVIKKLVHRHAWLAIGYSMFGREEEARYHVAEGLKADPNWSLEMEGEIYSYKNPADLERQVDALRKVGLPEHPPKKASD